MKRRLRWRCALCPDWGYGATEVERLDAFEKHYAEKHREAACQGG